MIPAGTVAGIVYTACFPVHFFDFFRLPEANAPESIYKGQLGRALASTFLGRRLMR
jgi:hypothetical protein